MDIPYQKLEKIGAGSFSTVYKGIHKETKQLVAIKILNLDTAEDEVADIRTEISLLTQLKLADVQNVTRYYGSHLYGSKLWIIMDYCHGGSIRTLMEAGRIEEKYIAIIIREVLLGLAYVHRCGIIHRDIKAANILMANDGRIQLCDFGVATQLAANHLKRNTFVGTPYWMAPEVITEGSMYNFKADIWSLGITVYEIATTRPPYADQEQMRALFLIPRSQPARLEGSEFSQQIKEFVGICLQLSPDQRPTADELSKTRFIKATSKQPTSMLRDLIIRYARWQEAGGVRQSMMISNRRGSSVSNDENEPELDHEGEIVAWDFDTSFPDLNSSTSSDEQALLPTDSAVFFDESPYNTVQSRPLRSGSQATITSTSVLPPPLPLSGGISSEHPLEQLFNDGTIRSATAQPTLRPRKDTIPSRPVSPLPLTIPGQHAPSSEIDLRLPDIAPIAPIQIEIPSTEETLKKDPPPPGGRSRSTTITRTARSDSAGASSSRNIRHVPTTETQAPHSPPMPTRAATPNPTNMPPPPLPSSILASKSSNAPLSPPKSAPVVPPLPISPPSGHIPSKSIPNLPTSSASQPAMPPPSQEHAITKARSGDLKSSRPPNLNLNLANQTHLTPSELSPTIGGRPRAATTIDSTSLPSSISGPPTAIPLPTHTNGDFALPPLTPLNLAVLAEDLPSGNGAGTLLTDELERILVGMAGILDVVGNGLSALEGHSRSVEGGTGKNGVNGELENGESGVQMRDRLDSLTSLVTSGGTVIRRT